MTDAWLPRVVLAIDPGVTGSLAWCDSTGKLIAIADMPVVDVRGKKRVSASQLKIIMSKREVDVVVIEEVVAMPRRGKDGGEIKMGSASMISYGYGAGLIEGVATGLGMSVILINPRSWKSRAQVPADKGAVRQMAQRLWPGSASLFARVKDHGRADAALLARYYGTLNDCNSGGYNALRTAGALGSAA